MYKILLHIGFVIVYAVVLFFGIGPVLMADGSRTERLATLLVVVIILLVLIAAHSRISRRMRS